MDDRYLPPNRVRHARRLQDGTVVVTTHGEDGRVTHAIVYDHSVMKVLEELSGDAAEAAYGAKRREDGDEVPVA